MGTNFIICLSFITILLIHAGGHLNLLGLLLIIALFAYILSNIYQELHKLKGERYEKRQNVQS